MEHLTRQPNVEGPAEMFAGSWWLDVVPCGKGDYACG
jgi:hypothetical protein